MIRAIYLVFITATIVCLTGCERLTTSKQQTCLKYKYTHAILIEYSVKFYPSIEIPEKFKRSRTSADSKSEGKEKHQIKDGWNNSFKYFEDGNFVYSIGMNSIDEMGKGDDILIEKSENIDFYCDTSGAESI